MDNMGPQSVEQVADVYREIRAALPGSHVFASTLSAFAQHLESVRAALPVITDEIGDTWIHGVGSDPVKVSRFRELLRLREEWIKAGRASYADRRFVNFNRRLLLVPEHTWGMDEKTWLNDHENYSREDFQAARNQAHFKRFESSWVEKRAYIQQAVNALEDHPLNADAREHLEAIRPQYPDMAEWQEADASSLALENAHLSAAFDGKTGTVSGLVDVKNQERWVDEGGKFGALSYQTFSSADYERFFNSYILETQRHGWALEDFTKPGMEAEDAESRLWLPRVKTIRRRGCDVAAQLLFQLEFDAEARTRYGAPGDVFVQYTLPAHESALMIDLQWFNKQACRLPEAMWMSFEPLVDGSEAWWIEKLGSEISPLKVVENGNRHLHASGKYVACRRPYASLRLSALDSPLVAPGQRSLLDFNNQQPDMRGGVHFCLLNNLWGTNFPMWFEEDCRFRFELKFA
jgi:hypothetical protein